MIKTRIVIASVLKPITEPRAFYKLALSLCETNKYHLNIIGFCSKKIPAVDDIQFKRIFCRSRTHPSRLLASFKFLREVFRYRPCLVIVTTYELLPIALVGKLFLRYRLIYDVQENYYKNVLLNRSSPKVVAAIFAWLIRLVEKTSHPFIDHYFFAEQVYPSQFSYIKKFTVLENKYAGELVPSASTAGKKTTFLISGTITPAYGVEKAIRWFVAIQHEFPEVTLSIVGHVPLRDFQRKLEKQVAAHAHISLHLSPSPLPYPLIMEAVRQTEVVLMPYDTIESIASKIPSKLYESMALKKPVLISKNPLWKKIITAYPAGLTVDFSNTTEAAAAYKKLFSLPLYQKEPGYEVRWEGEKKKLLEAIKNLIP